MKAQLLIVLLVLIVAGAATVYFTGGFSLSIAQTSSGCQILKPVLGQYCCKLGSSLQDQWSIPGGNGGWLECNGNRWECTFTLIPEKATDVFQNGYYIYYDLKSASDITIDRGIVKANGLFDYSLNGVTSSLTTKTFTLDNGQRVWLQKFYTNYAGVTGVPFTVSGTSKQIFLTRSEDAAQDIPVVSWTVGYDVDGCHVRKTQDSTELPLNSPLDLKPGYACQVYYTGWIAVPDVMNTVTYNGQEVLCQTGMGSGQRQLYSLKKMTTTDGAASTSCYSYPETFIKTVQCCSAGDAPSGYYCDTNSFTWVSTQPTNQGCQSDLQCPGGGATECKSTLSGNTLYKSGGCDLASHTCVQNSFVKNVDCCPSPIDTCQSGYYCSVSQGYICVKSEPGAQACPYACCDGSGGYQVKSCSGGYTCCQGTCPTADKPVCCGNGVIAKSQSDCGGTPPISGCAKEGQTPNEIDGCCEGYKITQVGGVAGIGARIVCTASGTYFEELLKYLPWILLAIIFIVVIFLLLSKKKRR